MSQIFLSDSYYTQWAHKSEPKLVHVTYMDKEASSLPRVLTSNSEFSEVLLVKDGGGEFYINDKVFVVKPNDIIFYNAGIAHDQRTLPGSNFVHFSLGVKDFQFPGCRPNCLLPDDVVPVINAGKMAKPLMNLFEVLYDQVANSYLSHDVVAQHLLRAIFAMVDKLTLDGQNVLDNNHEEIPLATRVRSYLDENFCEDISLQSLADRFNISSFYLAHIFKRQHGYPPLQYILRRRIGLAQTLLITTDLPVGEIGSQVGYANPSHFNLIFTKNVGISPRKYRMNYIN